jgi:hypothetical protein
LRRRCVLATEPLPGDSGGPFAEDALLSFIVRIWVEETAAEAESVVWRGVIIHVPSGTRQYVQDLADATAFIEAYLDQLTARGSDGGE